MLETAVHLTELPWVTVLTVASGYCGYFVAHQGNRAHHQTADITLGTLAFGFPSLIVFQSLQSLWQFPISSLIWSLLGFLVSVITGAVWSRYGRHQSDEILRKLGATLSDDCPSAWAALGRDPNIITKQISVKLTNGDVYLSEDLWEFRKLPYGPCTFGGNGDIILYVTHVRYSDGDSFEMLEQGNIEEWGREATYIPKEQIARVDIRPLRKK